MLAREVPKWSRVVRGGGIHRFVGAETLDSTDLVDLFRGIVGKDPVEVEGDPQVLVVALVSRRRAEDAASWQSEGDSLADVGLILGQEQGHVQDRHENGRASGPA